MPNIGSVIREEISRLSRKETRSQVDATRKATAQHRRDIAALKRQVSQLQRQLNLLSHKVFGSQAAGPTEAPAKRVRFAAKALREQRNRLGLSQADFGTLLGVSGQSIYNWESESARPRNEQLAKLAAIRGMGKREAAARLKQVTGSNGKGRRKT